MNPLRPMDAEFVTEGELAGRAFAELEDLGQLQTENSVPKYHRRYHRNESLDVGNPMPYRTQQSFLPMSVCHLPLANHPSSTYGSRPEPVRAGLLSGDPLSITEEQLSSALDHINTFQYQQGPPLIPGTPQDHDSIGQGRYWRVAVPSQAGVLAYPSLPQTPPYPDLRSAHIPSSIDPAGANLSRPFAYSQSPVIYGSYESRHEYPTGTATQYRLNNLAPQEWLEGPVQPPPLYHYQNLTGLPPSMEQLYAQSRIPPDPGIDPPGFAGNPQSSQSNSQSGAFERLLPTYPPKSSPTEDEPSSRNPSPPILNGSFMRNLRSRGKNNRRDGLKFQCSLCRKQYCRKSTLKAHQRQHSGERPYQCPVCGKSFSQAANLTAHRRVHTGEKPFRCSICYRPFSQSSSLVTHKRTHTGERPYTCPHCEKAFTDSSTLTKHMRTHTGHKPYECRLCGLSFSQSGNLNRHMKTHFRQQQQQENSIFSRPGI